MIYVKGISLVNRKGDDDEEDDTEPETKPPSK